MRKLLLSLALLLAQLTVSYAAKAWPYPMTFTQSDGTQITVRLHGDEDFHWYTDMQGNILQRTGNDFKILNVDPATFVAQGQAKRKAAAKRREPVGQSRYYFPHTGSPKAVVILAQYSDKPFLLPDPKASFDQYLNKETGPQENLGNDEHRNYGSVKQYFQDMSYGTYSPQFDVYGPVTLPHPLEYYGGTDEYGSDEIYQQLLTDAVTAADGQVDYSQYDSNNDGYVDLVYVIYSGFGQSSGGDNNTIWPKSFNASTSITFDGMRIARAGVSNELIHPDVPTRINGIGLFVHEFSHCLGLPDLYTVNAPDNNGMEDWSVMDNGEYGANGYYPTAYTAWEREAMGWENIPAISEEGQYSLTDEQNKRAVKVVNPNDSKDYFVLEHFANQGWNRYIGRSGSFAPTLEGMLIYHVHYNGSTVNVGDRPNSNTSHPRMTVVPADGQLISSYRIDSNDEGSVSTLAYKQSIAGDIFSDGASFKQSSGLPHAAWWSTTADQPVYKISYANNAVTFDFLKEIDTAINSIQVDTDKDQHVYTIDGRYLGTSTQGLPHGIYIVGGKKRVL